MRRPLLVWLVFAACACLGLGVLGWFTREMLRFELAAEDTRRLAATEENVRLALWRMDSAVASIHGQEAARSWKDYEPFAPADAAYSAQLASLPPGAVMLPSPLLAYTPSFVRLHFQMDADGAMSSPQAPEPEWRAAAFSAGVTPQRLQSSLAGLANLRSRLGYADLAARVGETAELRLTSVTSRLRDPVAAHDVRRNVGPSASVAEPEETPAQAEVYAAAALQQQPLPQAQQAAPIEAQKLKSAVEQQQRDDLFYTQNTLNAPATRRADPAFDSTVAQNDEAESSSSFLKSAPRSEAEPVRSRTAPARQQTFEPAAAAPSGQVAAKAAGTVPSSQEVFTGGKEATARGLLGWEENRDNDGAGAAPSFADILSPEDLVGPLTGAADGITNFVTSTPAVREGAMQPLWADGELVFVRRVDIGGRALLQGAWLDWPELRAWLLGRVSDLFPNAQLEPVDAEAGDAGNDTARRLAFLPVRLVPGVAPAATESGWSPLRVSLAAAWTFALIGAAALALLLAGTLRLSERRGAFVSAVTHELRTPLTTFRMYTEMLAGGMVDPSRRASYLDTLRKEAERLSHLVENVLSYARLERGRASSRVEDTTPGELLTRLEERLRQRAGQGNLALKIEFAGDMADRPLRTDVTAVEQILFNLVDNAAKYARPKSGSADLHLAVVPRKPAGVSLVVRDHGPGLPAAARRRLFQPFSKSAIEAAHSQPGVGLGLALSRRLARDELHGELALEHSGPDGTAFRLELPAR